ncbi:MAG: hypothetical protein PVG83_06175 [Acidimicrobiia bacterium]
MSRGSVRRSVVLAAVIGLAVACSPDDSASTTTTTLATPTTTVAPATTTTVPTTTTTLPPTTTTTLPTTTTTLPEFPPAGGLDHGGESWAVYIAVADDFGDPSLDEASALADSYGFFAGTTDINCDQGAAEAIGVAPGGSEAVVGVYFETELDANQFVIAWEARGHTVAGVGLVQTFCLD